MFIQEDIEKGMASVLFDFLTEPGFYPLGKIAFPGSVHTLSKSCLSICVDVHFRGEQHTHEFQINEIIKCK